MVDRRVGNRRRTATVWYVVAMMFIAVIVSMASGYIYVSHLQDVQRTQAKQACIAIQKLHDKYIGLNTPSAADIAEVWAQIYVIAGCK